MKQIITVVALMASLSAAAQKEKKDTAAVTAATPILSMSDMEALDREVLSELPAKYTDALRAWIRQRIQQKITKKP